MALALFYLILNQGYNENPIRNLPGHWWVLRPRRPWVDWSTYCRYWFWNTALLSLCCWGLVQFQNHKGFGRWFPSAERGSGSGGSVLEQCRRSRRLRGGTSENCSVGSFCWARVATWSPLVTVRVPCLKQRVGNRTGYSGSCCAVRKSSQKNILVPNTSSLIYIYL